MSDASAPLDPLDYLPLVRRIAAKAWASLPRAVRGTLDYDDLVSAGTLGLMQALPRYDATCDAGVETWASQRIWGEIRQFLRDADVLCRPHRRAVRAGLENEPVHVHLDRKRPPPPELPATVDPESELLLRHAVERALAQLPADMAEIVTRHLMAGEGLGRMTQGRAEMMYAVQRRAEAIERLRQLLEEESDG